MLRRVRVAVTIALIGCAGAAKPARVVRVAPWVELGCRVTADGVACRATHRGSSTAGARVGCFAAYLGDADSAAIYDASAVCTPALRPGETAEIAFAFARRPADLCGGRCGFAVFDTPVAGDEVVAFANALERSAPRRGRERALVSECRAIVEHYRSFGLPSPLARLAVVDPASIVAGCLLATRELVGCLARAPDEAGTVVCVARARDAGNAP
jgi:hypothetical protein